MFSFVRRRILPRTLFGRTFLILVLPVVLMQIMATLLVVQRHWDSVTRRLALTVAKELDTITAFSGTQNEASFEAALEVISRKIGYEVGFVHDEAVEPAPPTRFYRFDQRAVIASLEEHFSGPVYVGFSSKSDLVDIRIGTESGVIRALVPRERLGPRRPYQLVVWIAATGFGLLFIAALFLRNQIRPIRRLAEAVEDFGKGRDDVSLRPRGAAEIRRAANAFVGMKARIERQMEQRSLLLSGVSHDLRTPLTRMMLTLEMREEDEEIAALKSDVRSMERMITEYLGFARGQRVENTVETDVSVLVQQAVADMRRAEATVTLSEYIRMPEGNMLRIRPDMIRRAVDNLLQNAQRYGSRIRVSFRAEKSVVEIWVEDDGPGIPPAKRQEVFRPFVRLENARTLQEKDDGVGLGLSISRDIARAHGGDIHLEASELGGLKAVLRLPR